MPGTPTKMPLSPLEDINLATDLLRKIAETIPPGSIIGSSPAYWYVGNALEALERAKRGLQRPALLQDVSPWASGLSSLEETAPDTEAPEG